MDHNLISEREIFDPVTTETVGLVGTSGLPIADAEIMALPTLQAPEESWTEIVAGDVRQAS